jgi:hypothetical protein
MRIGELAKRSSLTSDGLRFYEKRQLLPKAARAQADFGCTPRRTSPAICSVSIEYPISSLGRFRFQVCD